MVRTQKGRTSIVLTAVACALASGWWFSYAGNPWSAFRDWTNDKAEEIWGYESNCPQSRPLAPTEDLLSNACTDTGRALVFSPSNPLEIGLSLEELEEWTWITEAIALRQVAMKRNREALVEMQLVVERLERREPAGLQAVADDVARIEQNAVLLAKLELEEESLAKGRTLMCAAWRDRDCAAKQNELNRSVNEDRRLLAIARDELLMQSPVLAHPDLRAFNKMLKNGYRHEPGEKIFYTNLKSALVSGIRLTDSRVREYREIKSREGELAKAIAASKTKEEKTKAETEYREVMTSTRKQTRLLEELSISVNPAKLQGFEGLAAAGCRIEKRILKDKSVGAVRELAFNSALTIATLGAGPLAGWVKGVGTLSKLVRVTPLVVLDAAWAGVDLAKLHETSEHCESLGVTSLSSGESNTAAVAFAACQRQLSDQRLMAIVNRIPALVTTLPVLRNRSVAGRALVAPRAQAAEEQKFLELFDDYFARETQLAKAAKLSPAKVRQMNEAFAGLLKKADPELAALVGKNFPGEQAYAYRLYELLGKKPLSSKDLSQYFNFLLKYCESPPEKAVCLRQAYFRMSKFVQNLDKLPETAAYRVPIGMVDEPATHAILNTEAGEFLLTETAEGRALLSAVTGQKGLNSAKESAYALQLFKSRMKNASSAEAKEILERLRVAKAEIARIQVGREGRLSVHEQQKLREYSKDALSLENPEKLKLRKPGANAQDIFERDLFNPFPPVPAHLAGKAAAEWQAKQFISKMTSCIAAMPKKAKSKALFKAAVTQLGVNELFTVGGYVSSSGGKQVDWGNLPVDMAVGGVATFIEPYFATGAGSFGLRYMKMVALGGTKSGVEAGLFMLNPMSDAAGEDKEKMAMARAAYSTVWAAGNSVLKIGLNTFLLGMQCLYPEAKVVHVTNSLVQIQFRAGSSFGYFYARKQAMEAMGLTSTKGDRKNEGRAPAGRDSGGGLE